MSVIKGVVPGPKSGLVKYKLRIIVVEGMLCLTPARASANAAWLHILPYFPSARLPSEHPRCLLLKVVTTSYEPVIAQCFQSHFPSLYSCFPSFSHSNIPSAWILTRHRPSDRATRMVELTLLFAPVVTLLFALIVLPFLVIYLTLVGPTTSLIINLRSFSQLSF